MKLEKAKECLKEIQKVSIENDKKAIQVGLKPQYMSWNKSIEIALQELDNSISKDKLKEIIDNNAFEINTHDYGKIDVLATEVLQELLEEK